jgi:hypothetical protein
MVTLRGNLFKKHNMSRTLRNYRQPSRGLGDTIAKFTHATGIHNLAQIGAKAMGKKDCGCNKRQQALNKAFPYKTK